MTYFEILGAVRFQVSQGKAIDAALAEVGATGQLAEWVRAAVSPPEVAVPKPHVLAQNRPKRPARCSALEDHVPGQYRMGLEEFCASGRGWSEATIRAIRETSATLVRQLPDPKHLSGFREKGLVLGHVQSGKTANMAGLIARAADAGYRLVIVLAGLYNDLRNQTQVRLDQDIAGKSENRRNGPFVVHDRDLQPWGRLTRADLNGDFREGSIDDLSVTTPKLAVVKKNVKVLDRLCSWLEKHKESLGQLPALVIDDEADQASIDSNYGKVDEDGNQLDPTATNEAIRRLLRLLPRCSYVGFTATPFANVLIDLNEDDDLFPSDFICSLDEPPGYFGARQLFGLGMNPSELSAESRESPGLNVLRSIEPDDLKELAQAGAGGECPSLLRRALLTFLLSSAERLRRGHTKAHFSMFVHPSHKQDDQRLHASFLRTEIKRLKTQTSRLSQYPGLKKELTELWNADFRVTTSAARPERSAPFKGLEPFIAQVTDAVEVLVLNNDSDDQLAYERQGSPRRYVVVGGNRLSRGVTLEGLSVSVFLRDTNYYDTLLQMGRWFGYRNGYEELTRIFVDDAMAGLFADLARVELELRRDIEKYARDGVSPRQLAPVVRAHGTMLVTSPDKYGAAGGPKLQLRNVQQTIRFPFEVPGALEGNVAFAQSFVAKLGRPTTRDGTRAIWRNRSLDEAREFVRGYVFSPKTPRVNRHVLESFLSDHRDRLATWDIVIPQLAECGGPAFQWADSLCSAKLNRSPETRVSIRVLREQSDVEWWRSLPNRASCALILYVVNPAYRSTKFPGFFERDDVDLVGPAFIFPDAPDDGRQLAAAATYISQNRH